MRAHGAFQTIYGRRGARAVCSRTLISVPRGVEYRRNQAVPTNLIRRRRRSPSDSFSRESPRHVRGNQTRTIDIRSRVTRRSRVPSSHYYYSGRNSNRRNVYGIYNRITRARAYVARCSARRQNDGSGPCGKKKKKKKKRPKSP